MHGAVVSPTFARLAKEPRVGDAQTTFYEPTSGGWRVRAHSARHVLTKAQHRELPARVGVATVSAHWRKDSPLGYCIEI